MGLRMSNTRGTKMNKKVYHDLRVNYLQEGKTLLDKKDYRQASEKLWGATVLALKEYALVKDAKYIDTHTKIDEYATEIFERQNRVKFEIKKYITISKLHKYFYGDWIFSDTEEYIKKALTYIEEMINLLDEQLNQQTP